MDDERRQLLEEALVTWETGAEMTNDLKEWLKQPSLRRLEVSCHGRSARLAPGTKVGATVSVAD